LSVSSATTTYAWLPAADVNAQVVPVVLHTGEPVRALPFHA
jgi:hypothetical protein